MCDGSIDQRPRWGQKRRATNRMSIGMLSRPRWAMSSDTTTPKAPEHSCKARTN